MCSFSATKISGASLRIMLGFMAFALQACRPSPEKPIVELTYAAGTLSAAQPSSTEPPTRTPLPPTIAPTETPIPSSTRTSTPDSTFPPTLPNLSGEITIWYAYGGAEEEALLALIRKARRTFDDLKITTERREFRDLINRYRAAVKAGGGPDMIIAPNDDLGDWVRDNLVVSIDSYLQERFEKVAETALDGMRINGELYGVPASAEAVALYYLKDKIPSPPETTEELLTLVKSGRRLGAPGFRNNEGSYYFYGFWSAFGSKIVDDAGRCIADLDDGAAAALNYLHALREAGAIFNKSSAEITTMFRNGELDMLIDGSWNLASYQSIFQSRLGVAILPAGTHGQARALAVIDGLFVNPNSPNIETAVEIALFLTNKESSTIFANTGGRVPVRIDVMPDNLLLSDFSEAIVYGTVRPQTPLFNQYWYYFGRQIPLVLMGEQPAEKGISQACKQMNDANGLK